MGQTGEGWNAPGGRGEGVMSAPRTGMDKAIRPIRVQMRTLGLATVVLAATSWVCRQD